MGVNLSAGGISKTAALTAIERLSERWGTKRHLLFGRPEDTVNKWFSQRNRFDDSRSLGPETLERISHIVSIYDALHRLLVGAAADEWVKQENNAFGGRKPLDLILSGRFDDLLDVRRYVDRALHT